jgi:hypothetical protein
VSQRPDGAPELVRRLAEGALAHDHEHGRRPTRRRVVNSRMSAPSDRLPFFRVERRRAAIDRIVHYGDAAAVHTVFIDGRVKKKWAASSLGAASSSGATTPSSPATVRCPYLLKRFGVAMDETRPSL